MHKYKKIAAFVTKNFPSYLHDLYESLPFLGIIGSFIILIVTSTCAQINPLEGGPMDSIPPQLVSTNPMHESTGFKGNKIEMTFDKEIEIQDLYNKLVITPRLPRLENGPSYVSKVRGNKLILSLKTSLEENTTYTFSFNDAVRDTKERTAAQNPTLTFSTGDYVDSLYIAGQVKYLMTDQPVKDGLVAIYRIADTDTVHILNTSPDYFTKTNENGEFRIEHIKQDTYRICTGHSKENKLILDAGKEPYGFLETPLELFESVDSTNLYIVEANVTDFKLLSSRPPAQYFEITFSKPVTTYTLTLISQSKKFKGAHLYTHLIDNDLVVRVYNTLGLLPDDRLKAQLMAQDAMGNVIEKEMDIYFGDKSSKKEAFKYQIKPAAGTKLDPKLVKIDISFTKPIKSLELDSLFFVVGQADTVKLTSEEVIIHPHRDAVTIQKKLELANSNLIQDDTTSMEKAPNILLHIAKGAFTSVEKELNEPTDYKYMIKYPQECGIIKGRILTRVPGVMIQLLDEQDEVVQEQEIRNQVDYEFKDVLPGNYRLRVLALSEKDGKWHFGNINKSEPPNRVVFYPYELPLVANWELDYIDIQV